MIQADIGSIISVEFIGFISSANGRNTRVVLAFLRSRRKDPRLRRLLLPGDPELGLVRQSHSHLYQRIVEETMEGAMMKPAVSCAAELPVLGGSSMAIAVVLLCVEQWVRTA